MPSNVAPARMAALGILRKIEQQHGNSDTLLHSKQVDALAPADRNLCTAIVLGTLRWQRILDEECRRFLSLPDSPVPVDVLLALRIGAYQLLFLDRIPAHAAIFESVEWVKRSESARHAGLVNAVLRKIAAVPKPIRVNATSAYPEWMVNRWRKYYGAEICRKICENGQAEHPTALRVATLARAHHLESSGIKLRRGAFLNGARYLDLDSYQASVAKDQFHSQDEGSQLVAELLGHGKRILDCCAAPGGKTLVLRQNNPDAHILAYDVNAARLTSMRERLASDLDSSRTEFRVADASKLKDVDPFDRILCDVPCSGTGTLARNPEIRHRLQAKDLTRQADRQCAILSNALRLLAPGGRLVYSTCSLEPEENEMVVEACLLSAQRHGLKIRQSNLSAEFDLLERAGVVRGDEVSTLRATGFRDGYLRTVPGVHPCDGFFAALLERA
jgi:16S rRNA (cytosine967-C5)-methyltransferase